jgi:hypothetical protein
MTISEIKDLLKQRDNLLKKDYNSKEADRIESDITRQLKEQFNNYPCDFILETLTHFGQAPNVVYDDNGLFAVSSLGYQPVVAGRQKIEGSLSVFVKKSMWKKTIRDALWYYLAQ